MIKRQGVPKSVANVNGNDTEKNRQSSFRILKNKNTNITVRHLIEDTRHY